MIEFKLPDVGEGLTEAEIVTWHVTIGDVVAVNDTLVDIETAKSVVELPSPVAGTISALHAEEGVTVDVGAVIVSIDDGVEAPAAPAPEAPALVDDEPEEKPLVLVGTGPSAPQERRRRLGARTAPEAPPAPVPARAPAMAPVEAQAPAPGARAKPPVRLLARQLGVDLEALAARVGGIVSREHVLEASSGEASAQASPASSAAPADGARETRTPIKGVRKLTAAAMTTSAFTAPHVTEWLTVDITETMDLVKRLKADRQWAGVRVTPLLLVAKAFLLAIRKHPGINARWDEAPQEIVQPHYVNLGIAAATPRGLIVPNIKDAHLLDLAGLAGAMADLVETARSGKTPPADMAQGTITITNIGSLGVDAGTPILNPGEAAILAFGAVRDMPWVVDGEIVVRKVTQLAMSFDHRLVDGELGSNVLAEVGRLLHDPGHAMTYV